MVWNFEFVEGRENDRLKGQQIFSVKNQIINNLGFASPEEKINSHNDIGRRKV